jgi:hypothetical protein
VQNRPLAHSLLLGNYKEASGERFMIRRREFLIGASAAAIAGPAVVRADDTVIIKMGALKLIHSIAP